MKKRRVIFFSGNESDYRKHYEDGWIIITRPMGSKLFRAFVPEQFRTNPFLIEFVDAYSWVRKDGVYFMHATEEDIYSHLDYLFENVTHNVMVSVPDEKTWGTDINDRSQSVFMGTIQNNAGLN
jgi:hypothetical protein